MEQSKNNLNSIFLVHKHVLVDTPCLLQLKVFVVQLNLTQQLRPNDFVR